METPSPIENITTNVPLVPAVCRKLITSAGVPAEDEAVAYGQCGGAFGLVVAPEIAYFKEGEMLGYQVPWSSQREYIASLQEIAGGWRFRPVDFAKPAEEGVHDAREWLRLIAGREWPVQLDSLNPGRGSMEMHDRGDHIDEFTLAPPRLARLYQAVAQAELIDISKPHDQKLTLRDGTFCTNRTQRFSTIGYELDKMTDARFPTRDTLMRLINSGDIDGEMARYMREIVEKTRAWTEIGSGVVDPLFENVQTCGAIIFQIARGREPTVSEVVATTNEIIDEIGHDAKAYVAAGLFPEYGASNDPVLRKDISRGRSR